MTRAFKVACACTAILVGGCGGSPGATISPRVSEQLAKQIDGIRTAAVRHDVAGTTTRLAILRQSVITMRTERILSDASARRILGATDRVRADIVLVAARRAGFRSIRR